MAQQFRVIIDIPEDDEWEAQELIDSLVFEDEQKARAYGNSLNLAAYPDGTTTYLEWRPKPEWRRV